MRRQAFTLFEMVLMIVILGTLAGLALPRIAKATETQRARTAMNNLRLVKVGVEIATRNRTIPDCSAKCSTAAINTALEMDMRDSDFNYLLSCAPASTAWTVEAVRSSAAHTYTLTLAHTNPDSIVCSGDGCVFIGM